MATDPNDADDGATGRKRRPARLRAKRSPLDLDQILAWIDAFHAAHGRWPNRDDGPVGPAVAETWCAIDLALKRGGRGLPRGSSLSSLLAERRGHRNIQALPPLTEEEILAWADEYHRRTGRWPEGKDGDVAGRPGETWRNLNAALASGARGLPGGGSLARLLAAHRGRRNPKGLPPLAEEQILAWADAFFARHGRWPTSQDGPIDGGGGDAWAHIDDSLYKGLRGLPGGSSLAQLLQFRRGVRNRKDLPPLVVAEILAWAKAHFARHGGWPNEDSGPVEAAPGETWGGVNAALFGGLRGLAGGTSLYRLLVEAGLRQPLPGR